METFTGLRLDLLRFDVDLEHIETMPALPVFCCVSGSGTTWKRHRTMFFGESNGHLHPIKWGPTMAECQVLEMESEYSGWFVKYHVDLDKALLVGVYFILDRRYSRRSG